MRINTNVNAMIATNQMTKNTALSGASMEKLSTGLRITKAGDDAAGLAISEKMRAQIRGMEQADRNVQDGISLVQTAEGAMEEISNITQRMRELAVQASNETNASVDREKITTELTELRKEITRISDSTTFNGQEILKGGGMKLKGTGAIATKVTDGTISNFEMSSSKFSGAEKISIEATGTSITVKATDQAGTKELGSQTVNVDKAEFVGNVNFDQLGISFDVNAKGSDIQTEIGTINQEVELATDGGKKDITIQAGANNEDSNGLTISIEAMTTTSLGIADNKLITEIADQNTTKGTEAAKNLITKLDTALETINKSRATLGAQQNRLEYTSSNLTSATENLSAAESRIRDVDVAKEMVKLSKLNILNQASQAMVSQAKQQPESVSQLLR